jgi:hypothetical protein
MELQSDIIGSKRRAKNILTKSLMTYLACWKEVKTAKSNHIFTVEATTISIGGGGGCSNP